VTFDLRYYIGAAEMRSDYIFLNLLGHSSSLLRVRVLTFNESKQAITLPFSTWQLLGGWANLHSSSLREQVPL